MISKTTQIISLYTNALRLRQWYKNLIVFLALFFSTNLFNEPLLLKTCLAFLALSTIASSSYLINDIIDRKRDLLHPEKKQRPIASGQISLFAASLLSLISLALGLWLSTYLPSVLIYILLIFWLLNLIYSFILKNILFADILTIATLFVLRAIIGALTIDVIISPWLIMCPFFLSLFLSIGKRHADLCLLKEKASATRLVLLQYTPSLTNSLMIIATTLFVLSYALYSFLSPYNHLLYTLPFALYIIFRYYYLINSGSKIARHPEQFIYDTPLLIGILLWIIITTVLIY